MPQPLFDFFERIALELSNAESKTITPEDFLVNGAPSPLLEDLRRDLKVNSLESVIPSAVIELQRHFEQKGGQLPFDFQPRTGRFKAIDALYLAFVNDMRNIRSLGKRSKDFEHGIAKRLALRTTGSLHRVGWPRDRKQKSKPFNSYLKTLGFSKQVVLGREKDGGLDILWILPIGTIPHRPIVSVQCKNGEFTMDEADKSVAAGKRSLNQNHRLQVTVHVPCVLFNDYLHPEMTTKKALEFVPLGLSDLVRLEKSVTLEML